MILIRYVSQTLVIKKSDSKVFIVSDFDSLFFVKVHFRPAKVVYAFK